MISKGDLVTRKSYHNDIIFRVQSTNGPLVKLVGEHVRLEADADMQDLKIVTGAEYHRRKEQVDQQESYSYRLFRQDYRLLKETRDQRLEVDIPKAKKLIIFKFHLVFFI